MHMNYLENVERPTKKEQDLAISSYKGLIKSIEGINSDEAVPIAIGIEIEETSDKIVIPLKALKLLAVVLKATANGNPISIVPIATEMTTQAAAEVLGCSRPYLVKLLETGKIDFTKVGKHRRIKFEDVIAYKTKMKKEQRERIIEMMKGDEELGLYDT